MGDLFEPSHIVVGPLDRSTLSLAANLIVEIIRHKSSFDLLQLSVISPHAEDRIKATALTAAAPKLDAAPKAAYDPTKERPTKYQPTAANTDTEANINNADQQQQQQQQQQPQQQQQLQPQGPASPPLEPESQPEFDVLHATIAELRALGIPVVSSFDAIAPPDHIDPWVDRLTVPAPVAWYVHLDPAAPIPDVQQQLAPYVARKHVRKVCYVRPVEVESKGHDLLSHEVMIQFGVLTEELPYLPLDAASLALACPVQAATSALFPEQTTAIARRTSVRRMSSLLGSRNGSFASRMGSSSDVLALSATSAPTSGSTVLGNSANDGTATATNSSANHVAFQIDPTTGLPQLPYPTVFPIPLPCVMTFILSVISSRFIYDQFYVIAGAPLKLPGVSAVPAGDSDQPATAVASAGGLTPPPSPLMNQVKVHAASRVSSAQLSPNVSPQSSPMAAALVQDSEDAMDIDSTTPLLLSPIHAPTSFPAASAPPTLQTLDEMSVVGTHDMYSGVTCPQAGLRDVDPELPVGVPKSTFEDMLEDEVEQHLQMLHDHVANNMGVHLASLRTASGRTLGGVAMAFLRGQFSVSSGDYARVLHQAPPDVTVIHDQNNPEAECNKTADASLWADADLYSLAGGRYTVAVRVPPTTFDCA